MEPLTAAPRANRPQCKMLSLHDSAAKGFLQLSESSLISTVSTFSLFISRKYKHDPHSPCTEQVMFHRAINDETAATSPRSLLRHRTPINNARTRSARISIGRRFHPMKQPTPPKPKLSSTMLFNSTCKCRWRTTALCGTTDNVRSANCSRNHQFSGM